MTIAKLASGLSTPDYLLMRRVNRWRAPRWIRWWMIAATRAGDGWLWALCGAIVLIFRGAAGYLAVGAAALAVAMGILVFRIVKRAVGRTRPCAIEPHCWANLLPPDRFSFPSGHSITAFAVAVSLGHFYPSSLPALLFCASSVAVSRIMLGLHFLTDVAVGCALGASLGYAAISLVA